MASRTARYASSPCSRAYVPNPIRGIARPSFKSVRDNYPKTLITLGDEREQSLDGIRKVYALDWLAEKRA